MRSVPAKIWHIKLGETTEGPYSVAELLRDARVDYDTLVWREGFNRWKELREVPELVEVWHRGQAQTPSFEDKIEKLGVQVTPDGMAVDTSIWPPNQYVWLVLAAVALYLVGKFLL